ncbi:energy-dependent translational throttle protein EttA [Algisphaera agarilytica]|uniref:Energy-dependent translational throttle protein EttA n=1 Tax=Algisphaera agarilytica TaxID=1385975 RepID=A0A7X0H344_9BACT|nr:energy-dependent translational throttle protein EttA [Algisphaera agarilytica]MBB6428330.1 ATP-binding cassette ChvD family protein [Algisphaera agarilytica]
MSTTDETKIIYSMMGVTKRYDRNVVLNDVSLSYYYGAKIGVLGLNGAGKSTLLRILAGTDTDFEGKIQAQPGTTVGYLPQEPPLPDDKTVIEVVREAVKPVTELMAEYDAINEKFGEEMSPEDMEKLLERMGVVQEKLDAMGAWEIDSKLEMAMDALRCPPSDAVIGPLSGGEKRRVALCRLLLEQPDVLLLDEPTNHLDAQSIAWLEKHLQQYPGTVIAVTHDRYFLDNVAGWMLELDHGRGIPWKGNYSSWLDQKQKRLELEAKHDAKRAKELKREAEWIGQSPAARQAKNKARVARYEALYDAEHRKRAKDVQIYLAPGPRLGDKVLQVRNVSKGYGDKLLLDDVSFDLPPGGIVGIIGPNGAGKTTLFKMIVGQDQPDSGALELGDTVKLAYVEQMRESLEDDHSVWQSISGGKENVKLGDLEMNSRAYVARFNFSGSDQQQLVGSLSGGQRNRVNLARMLTTEFNVLLLDEPTNDLDVNTIRSLEEALENFPGCAVIISHDRWFLDRVATHILAFEGDSQVKFFEGNYEAYAADLRKRKGDDADQPHRIKYRPLTR